MERDIMSKARNIAISAIATIAITGGTAAAAIASPNPNNASPAIPGPPHRAETIYVQESTIGGTVTVNDVEATGPVAFHLATDTGINDTTDILSDGTGDTVRLRHTALPNPVIDLNTCTETWSQTGTWTLRHGTGIDAFAQGAGTFTLRGLAAFPFNRRGVCVLVKHPDADPLFSDFAVAAHGWASVPV